MGNCIWTEDHYQKLIHQLHVHKELILVHGAVQ